VIVGEAITKVEDLLKKTLKKHRRKFGQREEKKIPN
jgi:ribosome-associated translation inhibitor RaiA